LELVQSIEVHTGQKAQYELVDRGIPFALPIDSISDQLDVSNSNWQPERYIAHLLKKYYA
jgi:hypothetical protein